jgi:hypothetical protein
MKHTLLFASIALSACTTSVPPSGPAIFPDTELYTGNDPAGDRFAVTIAVTGGSGMTWASSDDAVATVTGTDSLGTVVAKQPGSATITVTGSGQTMSVPLTVTAYSADDMASGASAYQQSACGGCHGAGGPDITPSGIGKHSDAQVLAAVTAGMNPEGGAVSIGASAHSFATGPGIVAYLRSLSPGTPKADD